MHVSADRPGDLGAEEHAGALPGDPEYDLADQVPDQVTRVVAWSQVTSAPTARLLPRPATPVHLCPSRSTSSTLTGGREPAPAPRRGSACMIPADRHVGLAAARRELASPRIAVADRARPPGRVAPRSIRMCAASEVIAFVVDADVWLGCRRCQGRVLRGSSAQAHAHQVHHVGDGRPRHRVGADGWTRRSRRGRLRRSSGHSDTRARTARRQGRVRSREPCIRSVSASVTGRSPSPGSAQPSARLPNSSGSAQCRSMPVLSTAESRAAPPVDSAGSAASAAAAPWLTSASQRSRRSALDVDHRRGRAVLGLPPAARPAQLPGSLGTARSASRPGCTSALSRLGGQQSRRVITPGLCPVRRKLIIADAGTRM